MPTVGIFPVKEQLASLLPKENWICSPYVALVTDYVYLNIITVSKL